MSEDLKKGIDMEDYKKVRMAMANGARTIEDIKKETDVVIKDEIYEDHIKKILANACSCKNVSIAAVVEAVKNGADDLEKVKEATGANTACGRCSGIIENIINNKR